MPRRSADWNMSPKYARGYQRGVEETEKDYKQWYHLDEVTYSKLCELLVNKGRVTLRNNKYPMVMLVLSLVKEDEFYYILPIAKKLKWSRFDQWANATAVRFIWQGYSAQILLRKLLRYIPNGDMKQKALKALRWVPRAKEGGKSELTASDSPEDISVW